jgi:3-oxoacyl-[acyl-carrier protein] reductase
MDDVMKAFDLSGRVAVVTGAASGIGRASATMLAANGAAVVCADIAEPGVAATAAAISESGGTASARTVNVGNSAEVEALVAAAVDQYGRLDIMCNIAGIMHNSTVVDTVEADLDRVLAINLKGVFFGCQAAARVMVEQGSGSIVNMASTAIDTPAPTIVCYAMAKAGVAQLTKTLAIEVAAKGVRVNAVAPGLVLTGMTSRHFVNPDGTVDEEKRAAVVKGFARLSPMGIVGEPEDIGYTVLYLASDASRFVTGQVLRANGGASMI